MYLHWFHYFLVPKGLDDVRVVYNDAKFSLNKIIWAPNFPVPNSIGPLILKNQEY